MKTAGRLLLPHPLLSLTVVVFWVLLANQVTAGAVVMGLLLGWLIPLLTGPFWPDRPHITSPLKVIEYGLIVIWDICVANVQVAMLILGKTNAELRPAFIVIPLEITAPEAITALAATITLTPGTVSADLSDDGRSLLVHCLHAPEPDEVVASIKERYESRLKEIFR